MKGFFRFDSLRSTARIGLALVILGLAFPALDAPDASAAHPHLNQADDSDWWSVVHDDEELGHKSMKAAPARENFTILGLRIGESLLAYPDQIDRTLGRPMMVSRGDAGTGRSQACYESSDKSEHTRLIFEETECLESFYLFRDGAPFGGSDECVESKRVNGNLKAASGLGLGMTREQVARLLGAPTVSNGDSVQYIYESVVRPDAHEIEEKRRAGVDNPEHEYADDRYLTIKFRDGHSWYLAASTGGCGP